MSAPLTVNWNHVGALIGAQFRVDLRHPKTGRMRSSRIAMTLLSYGFSSLILAFSLQQQAAPAAATLFYSINFAFLVILFAVVSGHQAIMGYPREFNWMKVMPVTEPTHYVARLANVFVLFGLIFVAILVPFAALFSGTYRPEVLLWLLVTLFIAMIWTTLVGISLFWLLVLNTSHKWLRFTTAAFQGVIILILVIGYQLVGAITLDVPEMPWWPANWFVDVFVGKINLATGMVLLSSAVVAVAFVEYFPKQYFALLERLSSSESETSPMAAGRSRVRTLESFFIRNPQISGAYQFAAVKFVHDSTVRERLWPILILPLAFAFFGWWTGSLGNLFEYQGKNILLEPATRMHPSLLIILFFSCQSLVQSVQFSTHPDASWVFRTVPVKSSRILQVAVHHALNYRVLSILFVGLWILLSLSLPPVQGLIHIGFWWVTCLFVMRLQLFFHKEEPFSRKSDRFAVSERFLPLLVAIPLAAAFTAMQVLVFHSELIACAFIATMALINHGLISTGRK